MDGVVVVSRPDLPERHKLFHAPLLLAGLITVCQDNKAEDLLVDDRSVGHIFSTLALNLLTHVTIRFRKSNLGRDEAAEQLPDVLRGRAFAPLRDGNDEAT